MSDEMQDHGHNVDTAPGESKGLGRDLLNYGIGLAIALALTAASFLLPSTGLVWKSAIPVLLVVLAVTQMGVHLAFFLHLTSSPDNTNNILALAFGILIVTLVVGGSLWIMANLNQNMMPIEQLIKMQR